MSTIGGRRRSAFLPEELASLEVTGAYELDRVALVLGAWLVLAAVVAVRTFRWTRRDAG